MSEPIMLTNENLESEVLESDEQVAPAVGAMPQKSLEGALGLVDELDRAA
ncbi:MAG: hypothetical protein WB771_07755 [Solirubrobacterales bacterium]